MSNHGCVKPLHCVCVSCLLWSYGRNAPSSHRTQSCLSLRFLSIWRERITIISTSRYVERKCSYFWICNEKCNFSSVRQLLNHLVFVRMRLLHRVPNKNLQLLLHRGSPSDRRVQFALCRNVSFMFLPSIAL